MKVVILAAGPNHPHYGFPENGKPKCLYHVNGLILLERQVKVLRKCGIKDIRIVVSYKKELIEKVNEEKKLGLTVIYCPKAKEDKKPYKWGWKTIRDGIKGIDDDVIISFGDIYLTVEGFKKVLKTKEKDGIVVVRNVGGILMFKIDRKYLPEIRKLRDPYIVRLLYHFCLRKKGLGWGTKESRTKNALTVSGKLIRDVDWYYSDTDEGKKEKGRAVTISHNL